MRVLAKSWPTWPHFDKTYNGLSVKISSFGLHIWKLDWFNCQFNNHDDDDNFGWRHHPLILKKRFHAIGLLVSPNPQHPLLYWFIHISNPMSMKPLSFHLCSDGDSHLPTCLLFLVWPYLILLIIMWFFFPFFFSILIFK